MIRWFSSLLIPLLLFAGFCFLYIHHLSPSVFGGDVGDLVTAAYVGGVPHPPGYPLFTLLGFLFSHFLPVTQTVAWKVGLLSALASTGSLVLFYLLLKRLTQSLLVSFLTTLILGFNYYFWLYAEIAEVFALNTFFAIALVYVAMLVQKSEITNYRRGAYVLYLFFFIFGLALTNHHTVVLLLPSCILLLLSRIRRNFGLFSLTPSLSHGLQNGHNNLLKIISICLLTFLLGFSVYIYIPIASSHNPPVNWDRVDDLESFIQLLLRRDYGTFSSGVFETVNIYQRLISIKVYFQSLQWSLTLPVLLLASIGAIVLLMKKRLLFFSCSLGFLLSGPVFLFYAGFPLKGNFFIGVYERFFLMSIPFVLIFFSTGLVWLTSILGKIVRRPIYILLFQAIFLIIPLSLFLNNISRTDLSTVWSGDLLGYDLLSPLPAGSILFLAGDTALFNTQYMHYVRGVRPDILIVNMNAPGAHPFIEKAFEKTLTRFPRLSQQELFPRTLVQLVQERPVFANQRVVLPASENASWIPSGLVFHLIPTKSLSQQVFTVHANAIWRQMHLPRSSQAMNQLTIADIPSLYAEALLATGGHYLTDYNQKKLAAAYFDQAILLAPKFEKTYQVRGLFAIADTQCAVGVKDLEKAKQLNPATTWVYGILYTSYRDCLKDANKAGQVASEFQTLFGVPLQEVEKQINRR